MSFQPKQTVVRVLSRTPVYRALPSGAARTYAALKYLGENSSQDDIAAFIRQSGGIPTRHLSTALVAARAVFRAGADDLLTETLTVLDNRFPESPDLHALYADYHAFYGDYDRAFESARAGRMLQPSHAGSVARMITYGYRTLSTEAADELAVAAVSQFFRSGEVLWAVSKLCGSAEQYARLLAAWRPLVTDPQDFLRGVRQLATAAARAADTSSAIELYREAIGYIHNGYKLDAPIVDAKLEGKGAWSAFEDLASVLDASGIPYFMAAGTALGLVREGRPLSADNDIDVGVFADDFDEKVIGDLFAKHPRFDFDVVHPKTKKVGLRHRGGSPIDIFRFYPDNGRMWHDAVFVRWHNSPFQVERRDFRGLSLPIPGNVDNYLTENYNDWRTPNSNFDAFTSDAPNVETTWPEYLNLHFVRRAYKRLTAGNRAAAAEELRKAGEDELATTVGASR